MSVTKLRTRSEKLMITWGVASLMLAGVGIWQIAVPGGEGTAVTNASHVSFDATLGPKPLGDKILGDKPLGDKPLGDTNPI